MNDHRRLFLQAAGAAALGSVAAFEPALAGPSDETKKDKDEEEISAPEDLMREHGVLNRILLIFEENLRRLRGQSSVEPEMFLKPARLVRKFVEDYHEKLEEKFIFPEFHKHNKLVDLVTVLKQQHDAGRHLTDVILRHAAPNEFRKADARQQVAHASEAFIRMYRPHEAREDTVLFPALYKVIGSKRVKELGEQFEIEEHRLFGDEGFEKAVDEVAGIEKQLGIYNLAQFTPKVG